MSAEPDAIVIDRLTVRYKGKPAVDSLSLRAPRGSVYALLGDNGAGKSTTMKVLCGLVKPDGGRADILGLNTWSKSYALRHRVGYVPERPKFYDWMRVSEIGWFAGAFHKASFRDSYLDWVEKLGMDPTKKLKELSKGGYARVGLALALAADPQVLLLDEPTSGLDLLTRREFLASLVEYAAEGRTILISSHSIAELERAVSHAAFVKDGKVMLHADLDDLRTRFRRVSFRATGVVPELSSLGKVLEKKSVGRSWQVVVQDAEPAAMDGLRESPGVADVEAAYLSLEEVYAALMARPGDGRKRAPIRQRTEEEFEDELADELSE